MGAMEEVSEEAKAALEEWAQKVDDGFEAAKNAPPPIRGQEKGGKVRYPRLQRDEVTEKIGHYCDREIREMNMGPLFKDRLLVELMGFMYGGVEPSDVDSERSDVSVVEAIVESTDM